MSLGSHTKTFFEQLKNMPNDQLPFFELSQTDGVKQAREVDAKGFGDMATPFPEGVTSNDFERQEIILSDGYRMPIHSFRNKHNSSEKLPTMIYFYGGGFCLNLVEYQKAPCAKISQDANCQVILIEYPLAPEHSADFIVKACYETVAYLYNHNDKYGIDQNQFIISGCSSGGTIAAAIVNQSLKHDDFNVAQQILITPLLDSSLETHRKTLLKKYQDEDILLTDKCLEFLVRTFAPEDSDLKAPMVSPLYNKEWAGLPQTLILNGEYDGLRGEGEAYAAILNKAGQNVTLDIFAGQTHNFFSGRNILNDGDDPSERIVEFIKGYHAG